MENEKGLVHLILFVANDQYFTSNHIGLSYISRSLVSSLHVLKTIRGYRIVNFFVVKFVFELQFQRSEYNYYIMVNICGIEVDFPFEPYECQKAYMEKVIRFFFLSGRLGVF